MNPTHTKRPYTILPATPPPPSADVQHLLSVLVRVARRIAADNAAKERAQ